MRSDRQNVGEHDQEAGNVYMTHPSSVSRPSLACLLSSPVCRLSSLLRSGSFAGQAVACQGVALGRSLVCRLASGFTLVELMVVVAVISIMLMLLIPNIRTMREKAWSSNCQNNLRQYGIAMNQYMSDYSGYFIYPGVGVGSTKYLAGGDVGDMSAYDNRAVQGATVGGVVRDYWGNFISHYLGANVKRNESEEKVQRKERAKKSEQRETCKKEEREK